MTSESYNGIIVSFLPCCYFRGWENCYFLVILIIFQSDSWTTKKSGRNYKVLLTIRLLWKYSSVLKIANSGENTEFRMNFKVFAKEILGRRQNTHTHTHTRTHPIPVSNFGKGLNRLFLPLFEPKAQQFWFLGWLWLMSLK